MATNFLSLRSSAAPSISAVNLTGSAITTSTITVSTLNLRSTTISLGQSTNQTYNNFSNGSYLTWATAKSAMTSVNKTVQSANGLYQMLVANATSGLFLSSDSGITWSTLSGGLPTLTGSAYWSDGAISANGQYMTLSIYGGSLWMSADYGRTFALTNQPTPNIWLPLNGNTTDSMGLSVVTATGSPGYVTLNYPGYTAQAVNLANTAGGTATRYIRGTWAGASNFTVSFWFNAQSIGAQQALFVAYTGAFVIYINPSNQIMYYIPSGGTALNVVTGPVVSINTWYYVSAIFQTNGTCSLYVNNSLAGTYTNLGGVGTYTTTAFAIGTYDTSTPSAFNGYIDDLRITNSVSTYVPIPLLQPNVWLPFENTAGDLGSHSLPPSAIPTIYLPFEGNVTDSMGFTTVTASSPAPTYVAVNREGYTGQALRLTNTAGGTAAQYLKAPWTGSANFTVSFWFNAQTTAASVNQCIWYTYNGYVGVLLTPSNTIIFYCPNGSGANVAAATSSAISLNTWYHVHAIFQSNGVCSLYVNGVVIGTYTNSGGVGSLTTTQFGVGVIDSGTSNAFNGIVDDLRIYNSAVPYVPVSITTVGGSLSYVPGVVGLNAVNLVNTSGGTATNFIYSSWSGSPNFTISGWFNTQALAPGGYQVIFCSYNFGLVLYINPSNQLALTIPSGGAGLGLTVGPTSYTIATNTWYYFTVIFQTNGLCSLYVNNALIGSATNVSGVGTFTVSQIALGRYDVVATSTNAFNGYIDDFRLYNAAIPIHQLLPQNYRSLALSGTGQYALASAASGWVVGSSDSSRTWSKQAVNVGTQNGFIQPNLSGLPVTATTWTQNGVTWTALASSDNGSTQSVSRAFNNTVSSDAWLSNNTTQRYTAGSPNGNAASTNIQTIGATSGEWIQIESSIPMVLASFAFGIGLNAYPSSGTPKTYYIVGSTDGTTWVPLQFGNFTISAWTSTSSNITMNITGTQPFNGNMVGSVATTAYPSYTNNAYRYFRLIGTSLMIYGGSGGTTYMEVGEWYLNFVRPLTDSRPPTHALSLNHTGQYQLVATGPAAGSVSPNLTGLTASTWTQGGVNWGVSASTFLTGYFPYRLFKNTATEPYANSSPNYTSSGNSSGITTAIQGVGPTTGDWIQLQSSVPLVMTSYQFSTGGAATQLPKTYYIVGSNDGSTWFPIQFGSGGTMTTANNTLVPGTIIVNSTSTQTFGSSTITTTSFSTTSTPYTYFRLIGLTVYAAASSYLEIGEWYINFSNLVNYSTNYGSTWLNTSQTVSNESVALSSSGQYALSTNSVAPFARLTLDNTATDTYGMLAAPTVVGTLTYDASIKNVGTHSAFFNNTIGSTPAVYLNYILPTALIAPSVLTMACWVYPTAYPTTGFSTVLAFTNSSSVNHGSAINISPAGLANAFFAAQGNISGNNTYSTSSIPLNSWTHIAMTYNAGIGTLFVNGVSVSSITTSGNLVMYTGAPTVNLLVGAILPTAYPYRGYVDDVRIYTSALTSTAISTLYNNPTIIQSQIVAVSNSYLPITSYTFPALASIGTATVVDTAVSQTGQYMVAVTSSTTNNVYYSTDFGTTFTALTVGSLAMVSCSISYDGSYLTVESATTVHTLNRNTRGFSVAVGNQAGLVNQAQNAIAIGDKAGRTNQSANSIVLNASGSALDAVAPGFYVAPIATSGSSSAAPFNLLGYGTDNQIVQSSALTVLQNGNMGIGTTFPAALLEFGKGAGFDGSSGTNQIGFSWNGSGGGYRHWIVSRHNSATSNTGNSIDFYLNNSTTANGSVEPRIGSILGMSVTAAGVGIGTTAPTSSLHLNGITGSGHWSNSCLRITNGITTADGSVANGTSVQLHNGYNTNYFNIMVYGYSGGANSGIYIHSDSGVGVVLNRGQNAWSTYSDSRMKINKVPLSSELSNILKLNPVSYLYDSDPSDNVNIVSRVGFLADEVFDIYPNLVTKDSGMPHTNQDGETFIPMTMCMTNLIPYHTKAIQELAYKNDALEAKNTELTQKLDSLLAWAQTQGFS